MNKLILLLALTLAGALDTAHAQSIFWRDSNDGTVGANWVNGFGTGGGETPGASNTAVLTGNDVSDTTVIYVDSVVTSPAAIEMRDRGATLQIRSGGSLSAAVSTYVSTFNQGNFTLSVQGGSLSLEDFTPSGAGASRFALNVSSGSLNFTGTTDLNGGLILRDGATANISGGVVDLRVNSGALGRFGLGAAANGNLTWTGGTIRGVERFVGNNVNASTVTNGGGTLFVNNNIRTDDLASYNNGTGTIVFGIEAGGTTNAQLSQYSGGGAWDLSTGAVAVDFSSGYTPLAGDSWDFTALAPGAGSFLASTGNIASTSNDGLWNITWDTSNWAANGVLGITNVTAIPEPGTLALVGVALGSLLFFRRRRS
jgi:hypothetical protein